MSKMDIDGSLSGLETNPRVCRCIPLGDVDNTVLLHAWKLWDGLKAGKRFPSRSAITPRILKPILRNTTLIKVIDGGADYEYRIVGDAYVMAHGHSFQGMLWSETNKLSPGFGKFIKPIYDRVVREAEPLALRGWIERGGTSTGHVFSEYLYLPLGEGSVDHILAVAVYLRRDGLDHATSSSFTI
jgi:hypothetical protein